MTDDERTLEERIQLLVDGRLGDDERLAVERELEARPDLRRQLESMRWLRNATRDALGDDAVDAGFEARLSAVLDQADAEGVADDASQPARVSRRGWLAIAATAIIGVALGSYFGLRPPAPEFPIVMAVDMHRFEDGLMPLGMQTADVKALETFFVDQGIDFETRVFDLGMMNFQLVGGTKHRFAGGPSAAFVYSGPESLRILCQMYRGKIEDLPESDDVREHDGIRFYSFKINCVSMTFWREGDVICVLASMGDLEQVVALAFAKAVKA